METDAEGGVLIRYSMYLGGEKKSIADPRSAAHDDDDGDYSEEVVGLKVIEQISFRGFIMVAVNNTNLYFCTTRLQWLVGRTCATVEDDNCGF